MMNEMKKRGIAGEHFLLRQKEKGLAEMRCEEEGKRKIQRYAKDIAGGKFPRLCHLLDVRFLAQRKRCCL